MAPDRGGDSGAPLVRLLGPIQIAGPDGPLAPPGARGRTLLALLALNAGKVTTTTSLVDALYGDDPPRTAVRTIHSHVSRVRQVLEAAGLSGVLTTREPGYRLGLPPEAVDVHQFEDAVSRGRARCAEGAWDRAVEELGAALELWRGEPLADGEPDGWAAAEVDRLAEVRLGAYEELWNARLQRGEYAVATDELERLLVRHPTRERLVGLLMVALCRAGRSGAALDRYERLRVRLAEEFGADPGPYLRNLNTAILRDQVPLGVEATTEPDARPTMMRRPAPAQLPPPAGHFVGRTDELSTLDGCLGPDGEDGRIVVVSGPGGMGKTALAIQWAHRIRARFPDGQIFLDLRGNDPGTALAPADVLAQVLRGLGVPADRVPAVVAEQVSLYRSVVHDRRVLLVLDNAGTADHVLPLVPPTASSLLVTTSRWRLTALAVHHPVCLVELGVLASTESLHLLSRIVGTERSAREPQAAGELARLCGYTPLALRIAAARLAARPRQRIADLVADLAGDNRLDALSVEGDSRTVRAVIASTYETLSEPAARLFGRLGLHPGVTFGIGLAAALDAVATSQARRIVDELAAAHLVMEIDSGRYQMHDLIRLYAGERVAADEPEDQRAAAVSRLLDWYLAVADAANRVLDPSRDRVTVSLRHPPAELPFAAEPNAVLSYLDSEHDNIRSVVGYAATHGPFLLASQLSYLVFGYFDSRGHARTRVEIYRHGLAAATRLGDPVTEGLMRNGLGVAYIASRRFEDALVEFRQALELMRAAGDKRGEGHVHNNIAVALGELRRYDEGIAAGELALAVHDANGHEYGMIIALNNQGESYARTGRYPAGLACLTRALELARHQGVVRWEAWVLNTMGEVHRDRGDHGPALDCFEQALRLRRDSGDRSHEAQTLAAIGATHLRQARASADGTDPVALAAALDRFQGAYALGRELDDRHLQAMALAGLGEAQLDAGDDASARDHVQRALALRTLVPDWYEEANLRRTLGELELRSGDLPAAAAQWDRAVDLYRKANATADAEALVRRRPY